MPLLTPQDAISFALRACGVLGTGQTASPEDNKDAFDALDAMLGIWNRRRWLIWHLLDVPLTTTGAQSYTIGLGGDFNVPRPDRLEAAFFRQTVSDGNNPVDYPLQILESREDYNDIVLKNLSSFPVAIFYDAAFPLGSVYPWPVPQAALYELHLTIKDNLVQFSAYNQSINLPPEFTEAIWTNLAVRLAAIYPGVVLTEAVQALAKFSLETIRGANAQVPRLRMPSGLPRAPGRYNIFSDSQY